jgi:hypothetical protein
MKVRSLKPTPISWFELGWPVNLDSEAVHNWLQSISGRNNLNIRFVIKAYHNSCHYYLGIPTAQVAGQTDMLHVFLPDIEVTEADNPLHNEEINLAAKLNMSSRQRLLQIKKPEQVSQAIIGSLRGLTVDSSVTLTWILGQRSKPQDIKSIGKRLQSTTWLGSILEAAFRPIRPLDKASQLSMQRKVNEPNWSAICYLVISRSSEAACLSIMKRIEAALKSTDAVGVSLSMKVVKKSVIDLEARPWSYNLTINVSEFTALIGWPYGNSQLPGITRIISRHLPIPANYSYTGKIIARSDIAAKRVGLYLDDEDALMHTHILGPTGVGKSTLMLNMIVQDIKSGYGVIVVDPKGDLARDLLRRIPEERVNDVVIMDPSDSQPVGLNPLQCGDKPTAIVVDDLIAVFRSLYPNSFGPRTQDIMSAGLLTLAAKPNMTLAHLPLLFSDAIFRNSLTRLVDDNEGITSFWKWFSNISDNERLYALAPVMNKLRPFLMREQLRRVIGQAKPKFDISEVFTDHKILIVNLARSKIGSEIAQLFGSLVVAQIWQAIQARAEVDDEDREPCYVYIDEVQDYLHLPSDIGEVLTQARSYKVGLVLAHQHLNQLPDELRSGVLANARSRVCFQLSHQDAVTMAKSSFRLEARDFENLAPYHIYAKLVAGGATRLWASGVTKPMCETTSDPFEIESHSRGRYGSEPYESAFKQWGIRQKRPQRKTEQIDKPQFMGNDSRKSRIT